jgi:uncharacterized protein YndB with AHSA1/START domain
MLKKILFLVIAVIAAFAAYVAVKPADYNVARSEVINAPPEAVYAHVANLKKWDAWSPWAKRDPNQKITFEGPETGQGAISKWDGNEEVGKGEMKIVSATPPQKLRMTLTFEKPFESRANVAFTFEPMQNGEQTKATWRMTGKHDFVPRAICTLMMVDMDAMVGGDYETGLTNLKRVVEAEPAATGEGGV